MGYIKVKYNKMLFYGGVRLNFGNDIYRYIYRILKIAGFPHF